jgi:hypothetical protein
MRSGGSSVGDVGSDRQPAGRPHQWRAVGWNSQRGDSSTSDRNLSESAGGRCAKSFGINGEPGGNRTHNPQIKRTAGDRPPLSARCFCLGISEPSLPIRPPVSTGGRPLVCQLVCQRRSRSRFHGRGNPLHAARKIGLESCLDLGCICSRIAARKHEALRDSRSSVRHNVKLPLEG